MKKIKDLESLLRKSVLINNTFKFLIKDNSSSTMNMKAKTNYSNGSIESSIAINACCEDINYATNTEPEISNNLYPCNPDNEMNQMFDQNQNMEKSPNNPNGFTQEEF